MDKAIDVVHTHTMRDGTVITTPTAAETLAAEAAAAGDLLGCALALASAGLAWEHVDLTDYERAIVEAALRATR